MKKAILFIALLIGMVSFVNAQTATVALGGNTYVEYLTDVAQSSTATTWFLVKADQHQPCTEDLIVHLDSVLGGAHASTVKLFGAKFSPYTWVQIGSTITWKATTADTTITMSNATATRYRFYKIEIVNASGDGTVIDYWKLKLYRE